MASKGIDQGTAIALIKGLGGGSAASAAQAAQAAAEIAQSGAEAAQAAAEAALAEIPEDYAEMAADLSSVKSEINSFFTIAKAEMTEGKYISQIGDVSNLSGMWWSGFVYVKGLKKIKVYTCLQYCKIGFYTNNDKTGNAHLNLVELISDNYSGFLGLYELDIPETANYIAISCSNINNVEPNAIDKFRATFMLPLNDINKELQILNDNAFIGQNDFVTTNMTKFIRFDANGNLVFQNEVVNGSWINPTSGIYETNQYTGRYSVTDYIEVVAGESYTWLENSKPYSYSVFDEAKTPISGYYGRTPTDSITIPQNGMYLSFCWIDKTAAIDYAVMIKGTVPLTEYQPPYDKLVNDQYATKKYVNSLIPEAGGHPTLELPQQYEIVVGDKFQLFWKGVINAVDYLNYYPEVICDIGSSYTRYFQYTGAQTDIGTHVMTVKLFDNGQTLLDEKTVNLIVKAKATSPVSKKVVLYVTDSLGKNGYAPDEFNRRLVGSGGSPSGDGLTNITFIGSSVSQNRGIKYLGNGGWSWAQYNASMSTANCQWVTVASHDKTGEDQHSVYADSVGGTWKIETIEVTRIKIIRVTGSTALPSSGTLTWESGGENHNDIVYTAKEQATGNPLWDDSQNKISFANYVTEQGESSLDYVYVLLGWNGTADTETSLKTNVRTFLDNVLADYPNCQIVILGIQIPARDGLAINYGQNNGVLSSYRQAMNHVFNLNKWYYEITQEDDYANNVSFVNVAGQFDTEYNMQSSTRAANARNSEMLPYQSNGVHPAESGYYQIADACYRDFTHKLQA